MSKKKFGDGKGSGCEAAPNKFALHPYSGKIRLRWLFIADSICERRLYPAGISFRLAWIAFHANSIRLSICVSKTE